METFRHLAPFGPLNVSCEAGAVIAIDLLAHGEAAAAQTEFADRVISELQAYFTDPSFSFTVPVRLAGSDYQQRLWAALREIPLGEVRSYGELAAQLNTSARAVGGACKRNPVPIIVPCHRVIAARSDGGFAGAVDGPLLTIKRWFLGHEGVAAFRADRVGITGQLFTQGNV